MKKDHLVTNAFPIIDHKTQKVHVGVQPYKAEQGEYLVNFIISPEHMVTSFLVFDVDRPFEMQLDRDTMHTKINLGKGLNVVPLHELAGFIDEKNLSLHFAINTKVKGRFYVFSTIYSDNIAKRFIELINLTKSKSINDEVIEAEPILNT